LPDTVANHGGEPNRDNPVQRFNKLEFKRNTIMSITNVIRAWKDADYRSTLSQEELAKLPANPAGTSELSDSELANVSGGCSCGTGCHCARLAVAVASPVFAA
jgi:mersacidin/lichenicidin family type 2 lantibiotic